MLQRVPASHSQRGSNDTGAYGRIQYCSWQARQVW